MRSKSGPQSSAEQHVCEIRRATRKRHNAEKKIRIVLEGLRGQESNAVDRRLRANHASRLVGSNQNSDR